MTEDIYLNQKQKTGEHLNKDGFFPLRPIAEKYGYSKDHLARLLRTGRILGVRKGNNRGDWFVQEDSLKKYHQEMVGKRFADAGTSAPPVPYKSSLNAEPIVSSSIDSYGSSRRGLIVQAVSMFILAGGLLLFYISSFGIIKINFNKEPLTNLVHQVESSSNQLYKLYNPEKLLTTAGIWSTFLDWLFPDTSYDTYVTIEEFQNRITNYEFRISNLENQTTGSGQRGLTGATGPQGLPGQTIMNPDRIVGADLNSILTDIASLNQEVDDLNSKFSALDFKLSTLQPSTFQLPPNQYRWPWSHHPQSHASSLRDPDRLGSINPSYFDCLF